MRTSARTVLILGGTQEAATIARRLADRDGDFRVISSLAGRTQAPRDLAGDRRIGGFGGAAGLASYLEEHSVELLIDATHPFATEISANAAVAANRAGVRRLVLSRPAWRPVKGDRWTVVPTLEAASAAIPEAARVFLALGRQHLDAFANRTDAEFVVRTVDPAKTPLPLTAFKHVLGTPGTVREEADLLRSHAVDLLVCRNSGGDASYAKIEAARDLQLPVVMVDRPPIPEGDIFQSVDELLAVIV